MSKDQDTYYIYNDGYNFIGGIVGILLCSWWLAVEIHHREIWRAAFAAAALLYSVAQAAQAARWLTRRWVAWWR